VLLCVEVVFGPFWGGIFSSVGLFGSVRDVFLLRLLLLFVVGLLLLVFAAEDDLILFFGDGGLTISRSLPLSEPELETWRRFCSDDGGVDFQR